MIDRIIPALLLHAKDGIIHEMLVWKGTGS